MLILRIVFYIVSFSWIPSPRFLCVSCIRHEVLDISGHGVTSIHIDLWRRSFERIFVTICDTSFTQLSHNLHILSSQKPTLSRFTTHNLKRIFQLFLFVYHKQKNGNFILYPFLFLTVHTTLHTILSFIVCIPKFVYT